MTYAIRRYRPEDVTGCRALWEELTSWHRELYADASIGGAAPGAYFDRHLEEAGLDRVWIADLDGAVVGLAATVPRGEKAELEPVVVAHDHRRHGVGRRLVEAAVADALARGARQVFVRPTARNETAIRFFAALRFDVLSRLELALADEFPRREGERIAGAALRV